MVRVYAIRSAPSIYGLKKLDFSCVVGTHVMMVRFILLFLACSLMPVFALGPKPGTAGAAQSAGTISNDREIPPPFGLSWNEDSKRVESKIAAAKLGIKERRKIDGRWALVVTGFKKPNAGDPKAPRPPALQQVLFYFGGGKVAKDKGADGKVSERILNGVLVEVELQYQEDGWLEADYNICLGEKRQLLERTYGVGQQIVRETNDLPDGKGTSTMVGYKWNKNNTAVDLMYFTAEAKEEKHIFHSLSLHYKVAR